MSRDLPRVLTLRVRREGGHAEKPTIGQHVLLHRLSQLVVLIFWSYAMLHLFDGNVILYQESSFMFYNI